MTSIQLIKLDPHKALFILVPVHPCAAHEVAPDALGADELKAAGVSGLRDCVATLSHR